MSTFGSSSHHGRVSITEDGGYDSYDDQMLMWRAAPSLGGGGNSSSGTTVGILHSHSSGTGLFTPHLKSHFTILLAVLNQPFRLITTFLRIVNRTTTIVSIPLL